MTRAARCYPFIEAENAGDGNARGTVSRACELLKVSRSAYYADRASGSSHRQQCDTELTDKIPGRSTPAGAATSPASTPGKAGSISPP